MSERPILFSGTMVRAILEGRKTQTRRVIRDQEACAATDQNTPDDPLSSDEHDREYRPAIVWDRGYAGIGWYAHAVDYPEEGSLPLGVGVGNVGDRLWVRETLRASVETNAWHYAADGTPVPAGKSNSLSSAVAISWSFHQDRDTCPSIHMPRWASRITLEITEVRVQRLQDISEEDAKAEGLHCLTKDGSLYKYGIGSASEGIPTEEWPWTEWESDPRRAFAKLWDSINSKPGRTWKDSPWCWAISFQRVER